MGVIIDNMMIFVREREWERVKEGERERGRKNKRMILFGELV